MRFRKAQLDKGEEVVGLGTQPYHHVDLDSMHMDLYKGYYLTPDDFLDDILRIQANAEVNSLLESDVEAPIKAGQMVNHSKVMIDQTFDEAFRAECAKMSQRSQEREEQKPAGERKKGRKGKGKELARENLVAVARAAAAAGGWDAPGYETRGRGAPVEPQVGPDGELEDPAELERRLKRARGEVVDGEGDEGDDGPAAKRARANGVNGHHPTGDGDSQEQDQPPVVSTSQLNGTHGTPQGPSGFGNLLNPTASTSAAPIPAPDLIPMAPELPRDLHPSHSLAPPMQVGALPSTFTAAELAGSLGAGTGADGPLRGLTPAPYQLQQPGQAGLALASSVKFGAEAAGSAGRTRDSTPVTSGSGAQAAAAEDHQMASLSSPLAATAAAPSEREATPIPLPDFILSSSLLEGLATFLATGTDSLNIDQLEQLRAACFDVLWRGRKAWERDEMVRELKDLAREFVQEVDDCQ